uniref:Uncharacterized protein n=1 Tax=Mustela putorius furo TaxID=9669 RepID=M3YR50_MUSPF
MREKEREREREHKQAERRQAEAEREAGSLPSKEPIWDMIPGRWDHDLSQRQRLNPLSHPGIL